MGSLKDETIAKLSGNKQPEGETIGGVKKRAEDMSVIDNAMETARKLSGAGALQTELDHEHKKVTETQDKLDKAIEDKHKTEIEKVEIALGAKIDGLAKSYAGGASKDSIAEQITEIKKAAAALDMGGSKVSELREMMNLITTLNPQKSMVDQIRDAKELISAIVPQPGKTDGFSIDGMPLGIALELKKMDANLQITLETMKDDRQRKDQDFQLQIKKFDLERADKIAEAQGKLQVEQDRNKMISGGLDAIGGAIAKGLIDRGQSQGVQQGPRPTNSPQSFHIEGVAEGQGGEVQCPNCKTMVGFGDTQEVAQCINCKTQYKISRTALTPPPPPPPQPPLPPPPPESTYEEDQ